MNDNETLAAHLSTALNLALPPVAVNFHDDLPDGVPRPPATVAAGCMFWELGARAPVATTATDHRLCSIGVHTHALAGAAPTHGPDLAATLGAMQGLDYVRPNEVEALPVMAAESRCVTYSLLAESPIVPAVVLVFARADQGLILSEAIARVDGGIPAALGRPACALIPFVIGGGQSAASLGCCGARAYLDALDDATTLWALHGPRLGQYVEAIESFANANATLRKFHERRRADVAGGETPGVEESLARLA